MAENGKPHAAAGAGSGADFEPEAWLSAIVDSAEDAIVGETLDGTIVSWNPAAERMFGYARDDAVGRPVAMLADPDRPDEMAEILARLRRGETFRGYETVRRRRDGSLLHVALTISPVRNRAGSLIGASKIARDITRRRQAERRIRLLSADREHRLKNQLAVVLGIVRLTRGESLAEYRQALEEQIGRLAVLDDAFAPGERPQPTPLDEVVQHLLDMLGVPNSRFILSGPAVVLQPEAAQTLLLAFHELGTNALKYGALSREGGRVGIMWERQQSGIRVGWREQGGPPVRRPRRRGLGMRIVQSRIEDQLGGSVHIEWPAEGVTCDMILPARHIAA